MASPSIRLLSHTHEEFPSRYALQSWLFTALKASGGQYLLRNRNSIADVQPGSLALFRYGDEIVGEAIVKLYSREARHGSTLAGAEIEYEACIQFAPSSIRLYVPPINLASLQKAIGNTKDISVARTYHTIPDWDKYALMISDHICESGEFL